MGRLDAWLAAPTAVIIDPSPDHGGVVRRLLAPLGAGGNLVSNGHLAALAVEHRCTVVSYDHGFGRFEGVAWTTPEP